VVSVALAVHALAPLLQNSLTGDGNGCKVLLRPATADIGVPIDEAVMGIRYRVPPPAVPVFPTTYRFPVDVVDEQYTLSKVPA
jgi:hypothetical protein